MIYAKTGMEKMPERCDECVERRHSFTNPGTHYCHNTSRTTPAGDAERPTWCPLREIPDPTDTKEATNERHDDGGARPDCNNCPRLKLAQETIEELEADLADAQRAIRP